MEQTTLYRKYRPNTFADVRSQAHVTEVLAAAIAKKEIPHAVIFTGTRGTGKTTLARIFARELGVADEDLYELDAASNNSVENVRDLQDAMLSMPFSSPYKMYIFDEAHMLSRSAWNALLKTLEEPPAHVLFVLATTDFEKIPDTVQSRCQVFTLSEPSRADIADLVSMVAKREGVTLSSEGAQMVAIAARGSYRDALSLTQKLFLCAENGAVTDETAARVIGAPAPHIVAELFEGLAAGDAVRSLGAVAQGSAGGVSMDMLRTLLLEQVRAVMLYRATKDDAHLANFGEDAARLRVHAANARVNSAMLVRILAAGDPVYRTTIPSLALECACVDLCVST